MKKCPYCSEEIQDKAKKCKHCGEWLRENKETNSSGNENKNKLGKKLNTKLFLLIGFILLVSVYSLFSNDRDNTLIDNKEFNQLAEVVTDVVINQNSEVNLSENEINKLQNKK